MIAINFRRIDPPRNTLQAFFDLELPSGLTLKGCSLHRKGDNEWVGLPASPQLTRDGRALITPKTGKIAYSTVVHIPDPIIRERFKVEALAAVHALIGGER